MIYWKRATPLDRFAGYKEDPYFRPHTMKGAVPPRHATPLLGNTSGLPRIVGAAQKRKGCNIEMYDPAAKCPDSCMRSKSISPGILAVL